MIKSLAFFLMMFSLCHAKDLQYLTFQKVVMAQIEMLDVSKQKIEETQSDVNQYVNEYKEMWGIDGPINFKCTNGIETLPRYSSVTPNTTLGKLISRNCERLMKLEGAKIQINNNIDSVGQILENYGVNLKLDNVDNTFVFVDKEERGSRQTKGNSRERVSEKLAIEKINDVDKKKLEDIQTNTPVEVVELKEKEGCTVYDQTCKGLPNWPDKDTVIKDITCNDIRKGPTQKWSNRYNFECRNNQVVLLSLPYQWVKKMGCSIKKNANDKERSIIPEGSVLFTQFNENDRIGVWSCVGGTGLKVASMYFKPVKCSDHKKKTGDVWETYGSVQEHECKGLCYTGEKTIKKRAVKWDWHCDDFGHIIPGPKKWDSVSTAGIRIKRVLIGKKIFRQNAMPEKFVGESCKESNRKIATEIRCSLDDKVPMKCPGEFPVAMSKKERDILDDMSYGLPVESCENRINYAGRNKCGAKGSKYLQCKKNCRTKCESNKENEMEESKLELVNYYPDAVRTDSVKKKK